ncbi:hypothetical protein [Nocardiopsis sp. NRRL B-16309]|uniref:hypothetical protein n=1 Tax=Nocardiopsis sp. NRRL B-16309 TaxID=1519494 RepID=UPI0006AE3792|nr:hypothetical protein [Nocardiopsis sp. NRRL B-16309]
MRPPRYKTAVVSWLSVYPIITLLLWLLGPVVSELPVPIVTLILTVVLVTLQTYVVMPFMTRLFRPWLMSGTSPRSTDGPGDPGDASDRGDRDP